VIREACREVRTLGVPEPAIITEAPSVCEGTGHHGSEASGHRR
jgi:hypothetical protein